MSKYYYDNHLYFGITIITIITIINRVFLHSITFSRLLSFHLRIVKNLLNSILIVIMIIRRKYDNDNDDAFGTHDGNDDIFFILIAKRRQCRKYKE